MFGGSNLQVHGLGGGATIVATVDVRKLSVEEWILWGAPHSGGGMGPMTLKAGVSEHHNSSISLHPYPVPPPEWGDPQSIHSSTESFRTSTVATIVAPPPSPCT